MRTPGASGTGTPSVTRTDRAHGASSHRHLRPSLAGGGLDGTVLGSAALRVSYRPGSAAIRRAVAPTGDPHPGLRVGRRTI